MKQVAAGKSIVHNFIILQVVRSAGAGLDGPAGSRTLAHQFWLGYTEVAVTIITTLDLHWTGKPRCIATALLRSDDFTALVDPGPGSTLATLREQLAAHRSRVADLSAILLTHIHLDHAGATGELVRENPSLRVYVHRRGAPHMVDPAKLLSSAERLYRQDMQPLFGDFLPVPEANLQVLEGGETISVGARELKVLYTPGHASHHVTYYEPTERVAFVGDTAGICIEGNRFILPATPPPDISLELWYASLEAIGQLVPRRLFLTHFGFSDQAERHLTAYRGRLAQWGNLSAEIMARGNDETESVRNFARAVAAEAAEFLTPDELSLYVFNGALQLSWRGLERYHRKHADSQRGQIQAGS